MLMRFFAFGPFVFVSLAAVAGCSDDDHGRFEVNEILFGVEQRPDPSGTVVTGGYEFLGLAKRGGWGLTSSWGQDKPGAKIFRDGDGDGRCMLERLGQRLGPQPVDNGVAVFSGAKLPPSGVQILANQPDPKVAAQGWTTGDKLTFEVSGFAMPYVSSFRMTAPRTELDDITIVPAVSGIPSASGDVAFSWKPVLDEEGSRVMVAVRIDDGKGGSEVRCFDDGASGHSVIPQRWITELFATTEPGKPVSGHVTVATHRQVTVYAQSHWIAYVVATTIFRDEPFTRN
jgi:hypothetical protein